MSKSIDLFLNDKKTTHILNSYIYSFIKIMKKSKILNQKTLYLHIKYIELFDRYLFYYKPDLELKDINENVIKEYKEFCSNCLKNNNKTVNKKLNSLNKFFKYLTNYKKLYSYNFMLNVPMLRNEEEKKPTIFKTSELLLLFDVMRSYIYGYRDISISKIILETGMLTKDILELKTTQISIEDMTLTIITNNKKHIYNLSGNLIHDLNQYLSLRATLNKLDSPFLFLSLRGNRYSIRSYQIFFEEAVRKCNLESTYSPRHLRSTFLYHMSKIVSEERLKMIAAQEQVKQYYELSSNPLRNLI
ncbi:tyrosine-type recombinase/integrase [uncultured Clostridium sp.]|uniref:tyrosine-type recombinase/integrase n=1 Tax=uncultured Clostridium sp. TaxID=59620 RepID=UPI0028EDB5CD|nr:tyrosine-type recombinase/integrase [uncultured Clostridium sp.]